MNVEAHPLLDQLAAHYVLGVMQPNARRRLEATMRRSAAVQAAVDAWSERLHLLSRVESDLEASPQVFARIEQRIDRAGRPAGAGAVARTSWRGGGWWSWLRPVSAFALGVLLCSAVFIAQRPEYETLTSTAPPVPTDTRQVLHVLFAPQTPIEQSNSALRAIGASIVDGPTELGLLTVAIPGGQDLDRTLATLRAQPGVQFAEPVASRRAQ